MEIKFKMSDKATWLATPLFIATAEGILSMKSLTEIKVNYSTFGTWLVAPWISRTEWLIDYIDLDNKVLGAHYAIRVAGTGFGGGSGYQLVKLTEGDIKQKTLAVADSKTVPEPKEITLPTITLSRPELSPRSFCKCYFYRSIRQPYP